MTNLAAITRGAIVGAAVMLTSPAFTNEECWATSGLSGYRFEPDRPTGGPVLCLTLTGGPVTGSYLPFTRVGPSTPL